MTPGLVLAALATPTVAAAQGAQTRIIRGNEVDIATYPFQVSVRQQGGFVCGGSILDSTHVVTAAHCVSDGVPPTVFPASEFTIGYGSDYRSRQSDLISVSAIAVPPEYLQPNANADADKVAEYDSSYDAALLTLSRPISFGPNARAIPIADPLQAKDAGSAIVTGWGSTVEGGGGTNTLKGARVPLVTASGCEARYGLTPTGWNTSAPDDPYYFASTRQVCAGGGSASQNPDTCQGDSGGPLVVDLDSTAGTDFVLVGLTSFGDGCGRQGVPAVYTWTQGNGITNVINPGGAYTSTAGAQAPNTETGVPGTVTRSANGGTGSGTTAPSPGGIPVVPPSTTATRDTTRPTAKVTKLSCTRKRKCSFRVSTADRGGTIKKFSATVTRKVRTCRSRGDFRVCSTTTRKKILKPKRVSGGFTFTATLTKATYKLSAVATDAAGNRSKALTKTFRVR